MIFFFKKLYKILSIIKSRHELKYLTGIYFKNKITKRESVQLA